MRTCVLHQKRGHLSRTGHFYILQIKRYVLMKHACYTLPTLYAHYLGTLKIELQHDLILMQVLHLIIYGKPRSTQVSSRCHNLVLSTLVYSHDASSHYASSHYAPSHFNRWNGLLYTQIYGFWCMLKIRRSFTSRVICKIRANRPPPPQIRRYWRLNEQIKILNEYWGAIQHDFYRF